MGSVAGVVWLWAGLCCTASLLDSGNNWEGSAGEELLSEHMAYNEVMQEIDTEGSGDPIQDSTIKYLETSEINNQFEAEDDNINELNSLEVNEAVKWEKESQKYPNICFW